MTNQSTIDKLIEMRLSAMADAFPLSLTIVATCLTLTAL